MYMREEREELSLDMSSMATRMGGAQCLVFGVVTMETNKERAVKIGCHGN